MVVRMRATRGHTGNRRSHHALSGARLSVCADCKAFCLRHRVCNNCGKYRGRVVVDLVARQEKVARKEKAKKEAVKAK